MSRMSVLAVLYLMLLPVGCAWAGLGGGLFGDDTQSDEPTLDFTFTASHTTITPQTPLLIGISTTIPEGYHLQDQMDLTLDEGAPFTLGRHWHSPLTTRTVADIPYNEFYGDFLVVYELIPNESIEPGTHEVDLLFEYYPCNERQCFGLRETRRTVTVTVGDTAAANAGFEPVRARMDSLVLAGPAETEGTTTKPSGTNKKYVTRYNLVGRPNILFLDADGNELHRVVGYDSRAAFLKEVRNVTEGKVAEQRRRSLPLWLGLALVGGLLAAFSPCVYPMIPITMGYLADQAGHQFRRNLVLVVALGIGVVLPFALIGAFIGALKNTLYSLTSNVVYIIVLDVILIALTASMLGAFEIQLPAALRNTAAAGRSNTVGVIGAFIIGLVVVPLAFACTAPALGVIIPFIVGQSLGAAMLIMVVFGLGLALPFLAAGTFTGALSAMPRAGAWMLGIKKVLALLLVGVIFYISRPVTRAFPDSAGVLAGAVFVAMAVGLGVFKKRVGSAFNRVVAVLTLVLGINFVVGAVRVEAGRTERFPLSGIVRYPPMDKAAFEWRHTLDEALAEAKRDDKLVMAYFWSYNCPACSEYAAYVWPERETAEALQGYVPVKINVDE